MQKEKEKQEKELALAKEKQEKEEAFAAQEKLCDMIMEDLLTTVLQDTIVTPCVQKEKEKQEKELADAVQAA